MNSFFSIGGGSWTDIRYFRIPTFTVLLWSLLIFVSGSVNAEEVWHPEYGWGANIPETWVLMNADEKLNNINFSDTRGHAILQVFTVDGSAIAYGETLLAKMSAQEAEAGTSSFMFSGQPAKLSDLRWKAGSVPVRGYLLAVEGKQKGYLVVSYAYESEWPTYHDFLLSNLDSFFIGDDGKYLPGPISQLVAGDGWYGGPIKDQKAAVDASQNVADREARVLSAYIKANADTQKKAWRRFYQFIYRDSFHRLDDVFTGFAKTFMEDQVSREKIPQELLKWVQSFKYEEYQNLTDLRVPIDAVSQKVGDCDGRGLVLMILLERLGFESILLISSTYHHSMVGVNIPGPGYYFALDGKQWKFAETTVEVPIGQIRSDMMDPKKWMGFDLHFTP